MSLRQQADILADQAGTADAAALAGDLFSAIAANDSSDDERLALLDDYFLLWSSLGFSAQIRDLLVGWRRSEGASARLDAMVARYSVEAEPRVSNLHIRRVGHEAKEAVLQVIASVQSGDVHAAIATAQDHAWFVDSADPSGLLFASWALLFQHEFDTVAEAISAWRAAHRSPEPEAEQAVLRLEATAATHRSNYVAALSLLEQCHALCLEHDLAVHASYAEAALAAGLARAGDVEAALRIAEQWPSDLSPCPLEGYRDLARLEIYLLAGDASSARRAGQSALAFFRNTGHPLHASHAQFFLIFCSEPGRCRDALDEYRSLVRRYPVVQATSRLAVLDEMCALGYTSSEQVQLVLRSRRSRETAPLYRAWIPPVTCMQSGVFWNQVSGGLFVDGAGPFSLGNRPVLRKVLESVLGAEDFSLPIASLVEDVWGAPYNPLVHETKVNVTLHRLRKWLVERGRRLGGLLHISDGQVMCAADMEVCVLEAASDPRRLTALGSETLREQVLRCLRASEAPMAPAVLEKRLGASRSGLRHALRSLMNDQLVRRIGRGRSTRYAAEVAVAEP